MNCGVVIRTECCKSNCSQAKDKDSSFEEYEVGDSESDEEEEEIDKASVKTFPIEHRP